MRHKAPGKHYRKGITLIEIFKMFPDDARAEQWSMQVRWPSGVQCPECGSTDIQENAAHRTMPYRCKDCKACGKKFSLKTNSGMAGSKLGYQVWAAAIYLLTNNLKSVSSMKLHRDLGITQKSACSLAHKIRKSFEQEDQNYNGIVEVSETR